MGFNVFTVALLRKHLGPQWRDRSNTISITGVFATRMTNLKTNPLKAFPNFRSAYLITLHAIIACSSMFGGEDISPHKFREVF